MAVCGISFRLSCYSLFPNHEFQPSALNPPGKFHGTVASEPFLRLRRAPGTEELRQRVLLQIIVTINVILIMRQSLF